MMSQANCWLYTRGFFRIAGALTSLCLLAIVSMSYSVAAQLPAEINLGEGDADATIFGGDDVGHLTKRRGIAIGDFNGDGKEDFALGVATGGGSSSNPLNDVGEVHVVFGSDSIASTTDLATTTTDLTVYGSAAGGQLGFGGSIAFGDINGDGLDDLIMGNPFTSGPEDAPRSNSGKLFVLYGDATRSGEIDFSTFSAYLKGVSGTTTIQGADIDDKLGDNSSIVVGDVTGDGIDDLVFAVPAADGFENSKEDAGEVYIIYGESPRLDSYFDLRSTGKGSPDVRIYGSTVGGYLGSEGALALGDVNGDGIADIIVGEPGGNAPAGLPGPAAKGLPLPARDQSGLAFVIFGSDSISAEIDLSQNEADVEIYGASPFDLLTAEGALATGDINGDGVDDILLGASNADGPNEERFRAGEAYIIFGGASLAAIIDLYPGGVKGILNAPDVIIYGGGTRDDLTNAGSMLLSDLNGDGRKDVVLGAVEADGTVDRVRIDSGTAYIIFGAANLSAIYDAYASHGNQENAAGPAPNVAIYGEAAGDELGVFKGLTTGDFNGDGTMDLALAAPFNDIVGVRGGFRGANTNEGAVFIIYGSDVLASEFDLAAYSADVRVQGADPGDWFGGSGNVRAGDVTGDGVDDLIAGAHRASGLGNATTQAGDAYVINGQTISTTATVTMTDAPGNPLPRDYGTARARIDYGNGAGSSFTTVVLTRSSKGISNLADTAKIAGDEILNVFWEIETDRLSFGSPQFSLRYTDAEAAGFDEDAITALHSSSLSGPWTALPGQSLDTRRNTVSFSTALFGFFALVADATVPSVTIEKGLDQADPATTLPVIFDVTFSEAVTGFEASDVVFSGTAESPVAEISQVKANAYTVSITSVRSGGMLIVSIPADAAIDTVGNSSTASTSTDNSVELTGDFTPPTVTVEQGADQEDPGSVPVAFDVMFSEDVTGFDATDVVIGGTATGAVATVTVVDGANYTIEITEVATFGTVTVSLDAGAATDLAAAANPSDASTSMDNSVTVEEDMGCSLSPGSGGGAGTPSSDFALMVFAGLMLAAFGRRKKADTAVR